MELTNKNVVARIAKFIKKDVSAVNEDMKLKELVSESFAMVELVMELQEDFSVRLNQEQLMNVVTVSDLINILKSASN